MTLSGGQKARIALARSVYQVILSLVEILYVVAYVLLLVSKLFRPETGIVFWPSVLYFVSPSRVEMKSIKYANLLYLRVVTSTAS